MRVMSRTSIPILSVAQEMSVIPAASAFVCPEGPERLLALGRAKRRACAEKYQDPPLWGSKVGGLCILPRNQKPKWKSWLKEKNYTEFIHIPFAPRQLVT